MKSIQKIFSLTNISLLQHHPLPPIKRYYTLLSANEKVHWHHFETLIQFLPSTEIESSDSGYKYEFTDMTPGNYTVKIIPVISSAQAVPFQAQIEPIESLFPIFFYSPIFIAILSTWVFLSIGQKCWWIFYNFIQWKKALGIAELTCTVSSLKPNYVVRFDLVFTTRNVRPSKTRHFATHLNGYT